ncbi:type 2 isopentenyl-diphosphate Delta-isomerase [Candidatus Contubernalis alkaliaceticus]|uniref:type 2 isopentenyl-diphosphate Delta-isomerase n=1 Tax=Candidatus Contubernalis alkaliaceticus TaxID=338645 RepID=UPI001F4C1BCE|nr:type 2 isopentenyl-diphosphate Delta-isomerase [Candidatus Contubernalis alkalaceticus]UNC92480.1 type 2 isopentenyl-diphosphate Delta-isomerase [Candidatus Contubernalis alkalaceticus]
MTRISRKDDHINFSMELPTHSADFKDCAFVHMSLPGVDFDNIDLKTTIAGLSLSLPIFINAITGGTLLSKEINSKLASAARKAGIAMAVGSQMAAIENKEMERTFKVVREIYPEGIVFANIGAYAKPKDAEKAVKMLEASALQLHLNVPQELLMSEGDRHFKGYLDNIKRIKENISVPLIVKEVGFGMSRETALKLTGIGVKILDIGGRGGTNFMQIEASRRGIQPDKELLNWGIPTLTSLLEVMDVVKNNGDVIASGGINNAMTAAKSLCLGAKAVGIAGLPIKIILEQGEDFFLKWLENLMYNLKIIMAMVGAANIEDFRNKPLVITGETACWMDKRGVDLSWLARR